MDKYRKVVVFTPMTVLEEETYDEFLYHEILIKKMFPESLWENQNNEISLETDYSKWSYGLHPKASFLAFEIGFSVLYETESHLHFYVGDIISLDMINYVETKCNRNDKSLSFSTFIVNENNEKCFYELDMSSLKGSFFEQRDYVYQELVDLLKIKMEDLSVERGR